MIESCLYSRWPFNDRTETAPRKANESGHYTITGLVNTLSLAEVATVVSEDKKGRKEDTTQKKLEQFFSPGAANNSLQLTN